MTPRSYFAAPTPLEPMPRLAEALGTQARLWVKRDDLCGRGLGGNKIRKLQHLVSDALDGESDTLITCGAVQSNHCRLTATVANLEGLDCHLVLREKEPNQYRTDATGNHLMYRLLQPHVHIHPPGTNLDDTMAVLADELHRQGKRPYVIPMGGSNAIGARGYADCGIELHAQALEQGLSQPTWVTASSSGGTQAGLVAVAGTTPIWGISVDEPLDVLVPQVRSLAAAVAADLGMDRPANDSTRCTTDFIGQGYAKPTAAMTEAVRLFARTEGLILDPVYTGKGAAGFIDGIRQGWLRGDVVFIHTGGHPALFHYPEPAVPRLA